MPVTTIEWLDGKIRLIDQTQLPQKLVHLLIDDVEHLGEAIRKLRIRGAPAIGVAAAFGVLLGVQQTDDHNHEAFFAALNKTATFLRNTRPTAVNLAWALEQMLQTAHAYKERPVPAIKKALLEKALALYQADRDTNRRLAAHGATLIPPKAEIITHCNTGALATVDYGTALGVIFHAHAQGKKIHVWVDETRPLLQGARLNMWELMHEGIDASLICDNTAAFVMQKHPIDLCIVGADRIALNGDTANKIGTYSVAIAAKHHGIPFYIAAPVSSIDFSITEGSEIPIEQRDPGEVTHGFGRQTAPETCKVYSPAFDVTPHALISAIITEKGIVYPPFEEAIPMLKKSLT